MRQEIRSGMLSLLEASFVFLLEIGSIPSAVLPSLHGLLIETIDNVDPLKVNHESHAVDPIITRGESPHISMLIDFAINQICL